MPSRRCLAHGQSLQFTPQRTPISIRGRCRSVYAAYRFTAKLRASSEADACIAPVLASLDDSHPRWLGRVPRCRSSKILSAARLIVPQTG